MCSARREQRPFGSGGLGGHATATLTLTSGQVLQVNVGGAGALPAGGFNGGAAGGTASSSGGGGGGSSDVRNGAYALADRMIVAGGGGGGGNTSSANGLPMAEPGGGLVGDPGIGGPTLFSAGAGGTQTQPGAAGPGVAGAQAGALGVGGAGACDGPNQCGGGGGGGLYGGGGANVGDGGGGGSGYGPGGTVFQTGVRSGNGLVTISYTATSGQLLSALADAVADLAPHTALQKLVEKIQGYVDDNNTKKACKSFNGFASRVKGMVKVKKLTTLEAAELNQLAHAVQNALGC